jgi:hypothetical protein
MRSRIFSTLAVLAAGVAVTAGTVGVVGSALGSGKSPSVTHQAGKIMSTHSITLGRGGNGN